MRIYKKSIHGWGRFPKQECNIIEPEYLFDNLDFAKNYKAITPRGLGRSYGDSTLGVDDSLVVSTIAMNKFMEFDKDNGVIKAYAGVSLNDIIDVIVQYGYFLPVVPGTRFITLGGALASNVHGKNHHNCGSILNFVIEFTILTESGLLVCSPDKNPELFNATIGGLGITGLIQTVTLKLKKITSSLISVKHMKTNDFLEAIDLFKQNDKLFEYSVAWIDCMAKGKNLGRSIVMLGNHAEKKILPKKYKINPLINNWKTNFTLPDIFPSFVLNPLTIKLFNFGFYGKQFSQISEFYSSFESFFFPLDFFSNWNILYGKRGFVQYQFAIPFENGEKGIQQVLEYLSSKQIGSFLAVLKIVKEDTCLLPFALPGFTLALDIPLKNNEIFNLLDELDLIVMKYGGRIYLTKDSRLSAQKFRTMYPNFENFLKIREQYNPLKRFYTLQAKRLTL